MSWKDKIRNPGCDLCPLHEEADHVCLMGSGAKRAEILLVGEAPGAREDDAAQAFVGAAGQLLTRYLRDHARIERDACYITNAAKCRPPDNRTPTRAEVKICSSRYLVEEIKTVQPAYILTLGNTALQAVMGKSGITKHRGTRWEMGDSTVMATFHPAAVLRNPKYGEALAADLRRFGELVRGVDLQPKTKTKIIRTAGQLKWLFKELMVKRLEGKPVSYDIETNGLDEWKETSRIVSIAFTWDESQAAFLPLWHEKSPWKDPQKALDYLKPVLDWDAGPKNIAHNGKFDARWLKQFGINIEQTFDTMLAAHMIDENRPKSLKHLSQVILNASAYDLGDEIKHADQVPLRKLGTYNGKDTDYTYRLYQDFKKQLSLEPRIARVFKFLMMPASNMLVDVERRGIMVDKARLRQRTAKAQEIQSKLDSAMRKLVPKVIDGDIAAEVRDDFNFNSTQQVAWWLFDHLELPIIELTNSGNPSTKESVLLRLQEEHKVIPALLKWRKWTKQLTGFLYPWEEQMDSEGRMHPNYKLFGTVTGRLSSQNPNLQQVPRDPFIRGILCAKPGHVLIQADFSQVELRIAAMLANEKRMIKAFLTGEDLHLKTAAETTGMRPEDIDKETRKKAKAVNFGFLYSMGAEKFVTYARDNYEVVISLEEAERVRERFFESYPALRPWHERQKRLARRYHRVHSPLGRVRHLPDIVSQDKGVRAENERQAINSPVQSTASDLMLASLVLLHERGIPIIGTIHDSGLFEVPEKQADQACREIKSVMEQECLEFVRKKFGAEITVPIVADVEVGTHWSEGEEWQG